MHFDAPVKLLPAMQAQVREREERFLQWLKKEPVALTTEEITNRSKVPYLHVLLLINGLRFDDRLHFELQDGQSYYSFREVQK